jgi:hypothetical protein
MHVPFGPGTYIGSRDNSYKPPSKLQVFLHLMDLTQVKNSQKIVKIWKDYFGWNIQTWNQLLFYLQNFVKKLKWKNEKKVAMNWFWMVKFQLPKEEKKFYKLSNFYIQFQ